MSTLESIEKKLDEYGKTLDKINKYLSKIAVQDEKISNIEGQLHNIWEKWNGLTNPNDGTLSKIIRWQASCPRNTIDNSLMEIKEFTKDCIKDINNSVNDAINAQREALESMKESIAIQWKILTIGGGLLTTLIVGLIIKVIWKIL